MNSVARMKFIDSNESMKTSIVEILKREGIRDNGPCPCPDCDGTLRSNSIEYMNTEQEPWSLVVIPVLSCKCGFQFRQSQDNKDKSMEKRMKCPTCPEVYELIYDEYTDLYYYGACGVAYKKEECG